MNFRTCKYFLTVCELGTINAAARKLFISQQSLSQHIRKLEAELGVQLFHRDNPLVLTQAGQCVKKAAQTVLDTMEQMEKEIADSGLVVLEGGTHFAYLEQATRFQTIVRQFLLN